VRQLLLQYIIHNELYPKNLIQVEKSIVVNDMIRRFDIVIYDKSIHPFILIEVKSHTLKLNQSAFDQVARYNIALKAPYLVLTNGVSTQCARIDHELGEFEFLDSLPSLPSNEVL